MPADLLHLPPIAVAETLAGGPGIVDLWYWFYEPAMTSAMVETGLSWITIEEHDRYRRFRFERDRRLFLATRVLVRDVLSRYAAAAPADWRFVADQSGKPRVALPAVSPRLHFNLTNTPGLVVCGVSVAHEAIGVDAERVDRTVNYTSLAARFFATVEAEDLRSRPPDEWPRRFFEYWTLKESYLKARGLGLAVPLDQCAFALGGRDIRISFTAPGLEAAHWRFASIDAAPGYLIAVGADTGGHPLSLRAQAFSPAGAAPHLGQ
ncbi:MAG: 4'-phosphopantetheinyl transferase superfamily protein [Vicinamibacterales bacterium]